MYTQTLEMDKESIVSGTDELTTVFNKPSGR